jgi:hypothetical protein
MTPTPGDITHRIGPSVPSPSLPARSYSVAPPNRTRTPGGSRLFLALWTRENDFRTRIRSLQGRFVCPLGYAL